MIFKNKIFFTIFVGIILFIIIFFLTYSITEYIGNDSENDNINNSDEIIYQNEEKKYNSTDDLPIGGAAIPLSKKDILIIIEKDDESPIVKEEDILITEYSLTINELSTEEKELICRIVYKEAGNQSIEGQRAVIEVILHRLWDDNFPNTIYKVLSQPSQFSSWSKRNDVTEEQMNNMMEVLSIVEKSDNSVFISYIEQYELNTEPKDYLYFDDIQHNYATNYIKIKDHWFGTGH